MNAVLHLGDAATVLGEHVPTGSVDMVYSDPPYGNGQVWTGKAGAFSDRWKWDTRAAAGWDALASLSPAGAAVIGAVAHDKATRAYLGVMAGLLVELRRVLRATGTLWLQFDDTMGAQLRLLGDMVFGPAAALGTIIWKRTRGAKSNTKRFGRVHDTIACWARTRAAAFRLWRCAQPGGLVAGDPIERDVAVGGLLDDLLANGAKERVDYPTQKPVALIRRFIESATLPGDLVLDPTCGSGTTLVVARELGRRSIGIDLSTDALDVTRRRLDAIEPAKRAAPAQGDLFGEAA